MSNIQWAIGGGIVALLILFIVIYFKKPEQMEVKMKAETPSLWDDVQAEFHTLVLTIFWKAKSATFWIAVILIVVGLQTGGIEGMLMALLSSLGYTAKETYQNVRFGQMKADDKLLNSPLASRISKEASIIGNLTNPITPPINQQELKPVPPPIFINVDTMPPFIPSDTEFLSGEQMTDIHEWYQRPITIEPKEPEIPDWPDYSYEPEKTNIRRAKRDVVMDDFATQAWVDVYPQKEMYNFYSKNPKCSNEKFHRINALRDIARERWIEYAQAKWLLKNPEYRV